MFTTNPLPLPPAPAVSPLFIVVTKAEVFVYNLALSLVLSEQVKQTHCPTILACPYFYGNCFTSRTMEKQNLKTDKFSLSLYVLVSTVFCYSICLLGHPAIASQEGTGLVMVRQITSPI